MKSILCFFGLLVAAGLLRAAPLPVGSAQFTAPNEGEPITVFTYKPATYRDGPLF
jgi:hypothetical protein